MASERPEARDRERQEHEVVEAVEEHRSRLASPRLRRRRLPRAARGLHPAAPPCARQPPYRAPAGAPARPPRRPRPRRGPVDGCAAHAQVASNTAVSSMAATSQRCAPRRTPTMTMQVEPSWNARRTSASPAARTAPRGDSSHHAMTRSPTFTAVRPSSPAAVSDSMVSPRNTRASTSIMSTTAAVSMPSMAPAPAPMSRALRCER
jgi:hypothetical protein